MRSRIAAVAAVAGAACVAPACIVPAAADARPTILKPLLQPLLNPLQGLDRGLLDLDRDGGGTLEELLLEGCNPLSAADTDGGGVKDGRELDQGTDCQNPLDDVPPTKDKDGDGSPIPEDCDDHDPAINPQAQDAPDPDAVDSNCDGFDGDPNAGVFVSPAGDDAAPGSRELPKRTAQAAIDAAAAEGKDVYLDSAAFAGGVTLKDGVNLYGGYVRSANWERRSIIGATRIEGAPQAAVADGVTAEIQLLELRGAADQYGVAYGLRAIKGAKVTLRRARVRGLDGVAGEDGADGQNGTEGAAGAPGTPGGQRRNDAFGEGGLGGVEGGFMGGDGGDSAYGRSNGSYGERGQGPAGGEPGEVGITKVPAQLPGSCPDGDPAGDGQDGGAGATGAPGAGGTPGLSAAGYGWAPEPARIGAPGDNGSGGGAGSGGGGGKYLRALPGVCDAEDTSGGGGGGGGAGGTLGLPGSPGQGGGGSFGAYLFDNATLTVLDGSSVIAGDGGRGGKGGTGGAGGEGAPGGAGGAVLHDQFNSASRGGHGGRGGNGGNGGAGGGGVGGPSIAIAQLGGSTATVTDSTLEHGDGGPGGSSPDGDAGKGAPGLAAPIAPSAP